MSRLIRSIPLESGDRPVLADSPPTFAWIQGDFSLFGYGVAWRFDPGVGQGRFQNANQAWRRWLGGAEVDDQVGLFGSGPVGFGSFVFDTASAGSMMAVPAVVVGRRGPLSWITTVGRVDPLGFVAENRNGDSPDRPRYVGPTRPDWQWMESVAEAVRRIESGGLQKVVLARDVNVWSKSPFDVRRLLHRLHGAYPQCFTFLVGGLAGASPELLLRQRDRAVKSVALAGTGARHDDPALDGQLATRLLASKKDRLEHQMTVKSVEDSLLQVCERLDHNVQPTIHELSTLRHLATSFTGALARSVSCFEVLDRLHPTAAVGGVPRRVALETISELEAIDRAGYAGPVGWFDHNGGGEWAIALRCAQLHQTGARLFAGAGIVSGSLPEEELAETRLKLRAMTDALDLRSS